MKYFDNFSHVAYTFDPNKQNIFYLKDIFTRVKMMDSIINTPAQTVVSPFSRRAEDGDRGPDEGGEAAARSTAQALFPGFISKLLDLSGRLHPRVAPAPASTRNFPENRMPLAARPSFW